MSKKIISRLLPWIIAIVAIAAIVIFVGIPLYATEEVNNLPAPIVHTQAEDPAALVMENDALLFEMDPLTSHFKVTQKSTGQEWTSNPANAKDDPIGISSNKEMMQSTAIVTYTTSSGTNDLNNFKFSIENQNFVTSQLEDGSIQVDYAIGKIEKTFLIPTAITKDRFEAFKDEMKKSTQKKLGSAYSLYDPNKKAIKEEIIALYPEVANQPLYILKDGTSDNNKAKIESYFAEANYTQEDYDIDMQLVAGKRASDEPVFNVRMIYRLEGDDLVLEIPYSEIRYKEAYPITYLSVLPMFGAADVSEEGFMFVAEGGGSIINYNNNKLSQNPYYANFYGWDYAQFRREVVNETRMTFPVFGMTKQDSSFLCLVEGANSYGSVQADISNRYNTYNWMNAKYHILHYDQYNVSARTSQLVYMYEKEIPAEDSIVQRYRFIDSNDYVDMAKAYGEYLTEKGILTDAKASEETPVSVELVGAIDKTIVKFGLPIDSTYKLTSFDQAAEIMADLKAKGVDNLNIRMSGWANGGLNQQVFTRVKILRELGGKSAMQSLISKADEMGVPLYFDGVSCFAYDSGLFQSFIPFSNAARYATREQVQIYPYDIITYLSADWLDPFYLVAPDYAKENTTNLLNTLDEMNAYGVSFRDIGYLLSADYNGKRTVTREEVKDMNIASMQEAHEKDQKVMIRMGNDYAISGADIVTDMDFCGTNYSIIDQNVPFYQIALHGRKDYTGKPMNLCGDAVQELLYCAEYGSGLNFTFIAENAKSLQDTTHSSLHGANYANWSTDALAIITKYQEDMKGLNQLAIVDHEDLSEFVAVTTYEDGTMVYVNYASVDYEENGVTVPARSYIVERRDNQ